MPNLIDLQQTLQQRLRDMDVLRDNGFRRVISTHSDDSSVSFVLHFSNSSNFNAFITYVLRNDQDLIDFDYTLQADSSCAIVIHESTRFTPETLGVLLNGMQRLLAAQQLNRHLLFRTVAIVPVRLDVNVITPESSQEQNVYV